ncbi:hypothetical protein AC1031_014320 [Aphanomyces cochlioides]|nr:hypothetical protein AC1031_014320 [Aphanomyces cochlioides]
MTKWITKLIRKQGLAISPDAFLDLVVVAVGPFACVSLTQPLMFVKQREIKAINRFVANSFVKEWTDHYIRNEERKVKNARLKLCNAFPKEDAIKTITSINTTPQKTLDAEVEHDSAETENIAHNFNQMGHQDPKATTIQVAESWENLWTTDDVTTQEAVDKFTAIALEYTLCPDGRPVFMISTKNLDNSAKLGKDDNASRTFLDRKTLNSPRNRMYTAGSNATKFMPPLKSTVDICVAIVATFVDEIEEMHPTVDEKKQFLPSLDTIVGLVAAEVTPFAKLLTKKPQGFLKQAEINPVYYYQVSDPAAKEYTVECISTINKKLAKVGFPLREDCGEENTSAITRSLNLIQQSLMLH